MVVEGEIETDGKEFTVIATVLLLIHPAVEVAATEYVVLTVGLAVTVAPVETFNPVAGFHVYVFDPEAVSVVLDPVHKVAEAGEIVITGEVFTFTVIVFVVIQPVALLPVNV